MNQTKKVYFNEIHFLRAFACLGVLLVHVTAVYYTQHGDVHNWLTFMLNQLGRFGTPTFAVISGFLLFFQVRNKGFDAKRFIQSRTVKIISPFIIWSIFYLLVTKYILKGTWPADPKVFLYQFTLGESFYHLYFMAIVIQFYFLFPFLQLIRSKKAWCVALVVAAIINSYFTDISHSVLFDGVIARVIVDKVFFLHWIFFFVFGGFMAYHWEEVVRVSQKHKWLFAVLAAAVYAGAVWEYKLMGSVPSKRLTNFVNLPILSFATIGLYPYFQKARWLKERLYTVGTLSMGIYLVHPFILVILQRIVPEHMWATRGLPLMFIIVLVLCVSMVRLIQVLPNHQYIIPVPSPKKKSPSDSQEKRYNQQQKPVSV
ncbi:acyltransferase [Fictibacillus iocasae]|uniref:Acyltransferase n=1 Tax=Fictibacillus iocasae TaxID=2715437 RepID=A0ABW2NLN5_9BACL